MCQDNAHHRDGLWELRVVLNREIVFPLWGCLEEREEIRAEFRIEERPQMPTLCPDSAGKK